MPVKAESLSVEPTIPDKTNRVLAINTCGPSQVVSGEIILPDCHRNIDSLLADTAPDIPEWKISLKPLSARTLKRPESWR